VHMAERRSVYSVLVGKSEGKRHLGRSCPTREYREGAARTLPICCVALCIFCVVLCIFVFYILFVLLLSLYCLCVYVTEQLHRVATQFQLNIS